MLQPLETAENLGFQQVRDLGDVGPPVFRDRFGAVRDQPSRL